MRAADSQREEDISIFYIYESSSRFKIQIFSKLERESKKARKRDMDKPTERERKKGNERERARKKNRERHRQRDLATTISHESSRNE